MPTATFETLLNLIVAQIRSNINAALDALGVERIPEDCIDVGPQQQVGTDSIYVTYIGTDRPRGGPGGKGQHREWRDCIFSFEIRMFRFGGDEAELQLLAGATEAAVIYCFDNDDNARRLGGTVKGGGIWFGDSEGAYGRMRDGSFGFGIVLPMSVEMKVSRPEFELT